MRSFELVLAELGVFPSWSRPRVLWVGSGAGGETLAAVAHDLERGFEDAGLGRADKPFVPHLTLGRWRVSAPVDPGPLAASRREGEPGAFRVDSVALMKSVLHPRGSIYTPLHVARFAS